MEISEKKSLQDDINSFPLIKAILFYIPGIIIGYYTRISWLYGLIGALLFLAAGIYSYRKKKSAKDHLMEALFGMAFAGMWICMGISITDYQTPAPASMEAIQNDSIHYGVISSPIEKKTNKHRTTIKLIDNGEEILADFSNDTLNQLPNYGDLIGFFTKIDTITSYGNPLGFNQSEHWAMHGIYYSTYIKSKQYEIIKPAYRKGIRYYGGLARQKLLDRYRESGIEGEELAVLEALTLGYKDDLDKETKSAFQASGAMHILAVSGLHTGIIMLISNILLSFMNRGKVWRTAKTIIIISILWAFAAITGFSSSVCRSALMFTIMQITIMRGFKASSYNAVAGSAFILLIFNPLLIFNTGFLLSYLAVMGILSCMPIMEKAQPEIQYWQYSRLKIFMLNQWKTVLGVMMVSVAAQIGTGILSMRTFGVFPVYFILTNFIVLPLSYLIMISAVALLALGFWDTGIEYVTEILRTLLEWLTSSVHWIESLPGSCITGIHITRPGAILLYAILALAILAVHYRGHAIRTALLASGCVFLAISCISDYQNNVDSQLIVYNQYRSALYSYVSANGNISIYHSDTDSAVTDYQNPATVTADILGIDHRKTLHLDSIADLRDMYMSVNGKSFYILRSHHQLRIMKNNYLKADYLIISNNTAIKADEIRKYFGAERVILDASNGRKTIAKITDDCKKAGIEIHNVQQDGAFVYGDGKNVFDWY